MTAFDVSGLTACFSDVEFLKKGIIKNKTTVPYDTLLGETGVGKSSSLGSNDIGHYNLDMLDHSNGQGGSGNQNQTYSARLYKLTSKNGIVVSAGVLNVVSILNLFPRSPSLIQPASPTLAIFGKTSATRSVLLLRSRSAPTLLLPFSC